MPTPMKARPTLFVILFAPVLVFAAIIAGVYFTSLRDMPRMMPLIRMFSRPVKSG